MDGSCRVRGYFHLHDTDQDGMQIHYATPIHDNYLKCTWQKWAQLQHAQRSDHGLLDCESQGDNLYSMLQHALSCAIHQAAWRLAALLMPARCHHQCMLGTCIAQPLTPAMTIATNRCRSPDNIPVPEVAGKYYNQRASPGGLILTEATAICPEGQG
jgi:hypothetical protein